MSYYWLDGIMGVIVGDALGDPVQFMSREEILKRVRGPVTTMEAGGAYNMPEGTWTDDGSMTLATLSSIRELGKIDPEDIMERFVAWYDDGEYTPFGRAFDIGNTCSIAIERFKRESILSILKSRRNGIKSSWCGCGNTLRSMVELRS